MPNPTRKEIIYAHDGLDILCERADKSAPSDVLKNYILKALPPLPRPTMAEVEWDDDKHYLAEAEQAGRRTVVMIKPMRESHQIKCLSLYDGGGCIVYPSAETLTPTGRRYTLTEVQE